MSNQIQTVSFHDDTLITLEKDGEHYVAVRPIVENMGLEWSGQASKLKNKKFNCVDIYTVAQDGKTPLDKVDFLFYITRQGVRTLLNSGQSLPTVLAVFCCLNSPFSLRFMLGGRRIQYPCGNNPSRLLTVSEPPSTLLLRGGHIPTPLMIG